MNDRYYEYRIRTAKRRYHIALAEILKEQLNNTPDPHKYKLIRQRMYHHRHQANKQEAIAYRLINEKE